MPVLQPASHGDACLGLLIPTTHGAVKIIIVKIVVGVFEAAALTAIRPYFITVQVVLRILFHEVFPFGQGSFMGIENEIWF